MKVPEPRKLKSGTWFIQMRLSGVSVPVSAATKAECKQQAMLIKAEHRAGKRKIAKNQITLKEAIENYIDNKKNILSPSTIRGYNTIKNNRFQSVMNKPLRSIDNWQSIINESCQTLSAKTIKNDWGFICSVLRENDIVPPKVALPQVVPARKEFLDPDEIKKFVSAVKGTECEIPALLGLHSLRRSEIMGLTWGNIDLDNEIIHVRGSAVYDKDQKLVRKKTNKNTSSNRDIPIMIPELLTALKAVPKKSRKDAVVTCNPNTIWSRVNHVCKSNGLPEVGVHGLRHSFASLAFSADVGMTEREVMEIGGWSDYYTVHKIYEHLSIKNKLKAQNKMKAFYNKQNQNANESANESENRAVVST